jgi:hypothetical protein
MLIFEHTLLFCKFIPLEYYGSSFAEITEVVYSLMVSRLSSPPCVLNVLPINNNNNNNNKICLLIDITITYDWKLRQTKLKTKQAQRPGDQGQQNVESEEKIVPVITGALGKM